MVVLGLLIWTILPILWIIGALFKPIEPVRYKVRRRHRPLSI